MLDRVLNGTPAQYSFNSLWTMLSLPLLPLFDVLTLTIVVIAGIQVGIPTLKMKNLYV